MKLQGFQIKCCWRRCAEAPPPKLSHIVPALPEQGAWVHPWENTDSRKGFLIFTMSMKSSPRKTPVARTIFQGQNRRFWARALGNHKSTFEYLHGICKINKVISDLSTCLENAHKMYVKICIFLNEQNVKHNSIFLKLNKRLFIVCEVFRVKSEDQLSLLPLILLLEESQTSKQKVSPIQNSTMGRSSGMCYPEVLRAKSFVTICPFLGDLWSPWSSITGSFEVLCIPRLSDKAIHLLKDALRKLWSI